VLFLTRHKDFTVSVNSMHMSFYHSQNTPLFTASINKNSAAHLEGSTVANCESAAENMKKHFTSVNAVAPSDYDLWHRHFGYSGKQALKKLPKLVKGGPSNIMLPSENKPREGCEFRKLHHLPFPPSSSCATKLLELIHADLNEFPNLSIDSYK
ncbi:hypothetical protein BV22DRAFT_966311, partial [Leucogyrophana mollusca]